MIVRHDYCSPPSRAWLDTHSTYKMLIGSPGADGMDKTVWCYFAPWRAGFVAKLSPTVELH
jgi:hypothetical protein